MAITGNDIVTSAAILLNDITKVRWNESEHLIWINDGRREMAQKKPTIFGRSSRVTSVLDAGAKQYLKTDGAYKLDSIDSVSGKAVRVTTKAMMDAFKPSWRSETGTEVKNWMPDETDPLGFWVYPSVTGAVVDAHAWITPTDLATLSDSALPFDQYKPVLVNYVCFRALSKEDEAALVAKAQAFLQLFISALAP